jgi:hypothetical protein
MIGCRQESPDRTQIYHVARKLTGGGSMLDSTNHCLHPTPFQQKLGFAHILLHESNAPLTQHAPFLIDQDKFVNRAIFDLLYLGLFKSASRGTIPKCIILQKALAAFVTDRAVEGMINEQKLQDTLASFVDGRAPGMYNHPFRNRRRAGCSQFWHLFHLH